MSEWKEYKLGDIATLNYGKALKEVERLPGNVPVYSSAGITGFHNEALINSKGIIVGRKGTVGKVYKSKTPFCCIDTAYFILPNDSKYDFDFLYYLLQTIGLEELNEDSAVPGLNRETAYKQELKLPSIPEQTAIASVLSSLDDKIDLLHHQNATLEKMAETLFRQWFVEEAKEEWEMGKIDDLFVLQRGFDLPLQNRIQGEYPIYASSGESGYHYEYKVKGPGVTTGRSGILGNVFYIQEDYWPLNTSLFIKEFKNSSPLHSYFVLKTIDLKSFNAGSAVPTLNRNHLHEFPVEIPPLNLISKFDKFAIPLFKKINQNKSQIRTLTALRDTLLPKLMSGEVRVNR